MASQQWNLWKDPPPSTNYRVREEGKEPSPKKRPNELSTVTESSRNLKSPKLSSFSKNTLEALFQNVQVSPRPNPPILNAYRPVFQPRLQPFLPAWTVTYPSIMPLVYPEQLNAGAPVTQSAESLDDAEVLRKPLPKKGRKTVEEGTQSSLLPGNPSIEDFFHPEHVMESKRLLFTMFQQPRTSQRKSYIKEKRYLAPNPLEVGMREPKLGETIPKILRGYVIAELATQDGKTLEDKKKGMLKPAIGRSFREILSRDNKASFSLMMTEATEGAHYCIRFSVYYEVEGEGWYKEEILSKPFRVDTNKRTHSKKFPTVDIIKPNWAMYDQEREIWIRGSNFNSSVLVYFGNAKAKVKSVEPNLLIAMAPKMSHFTEKTVVEVKVVNKFGDEFKEANVIPTFTYCVGRTTTSKVNTQQATKEEQDLVRASYADLEGLNRLSLAASTTNEN